MLAALTGSARAAVWPAPLPAPAATRFAISAYENVRVACGSGELDSAELLGMDEVPAVEGTVAESPLAVVSC